VKNKTNII